MIYTYQELLKKFKTRNNITKALNKQSIFRVARGIYSTEWQYKSLESITKQFPHAIITGLTAFSYYNLTTDPGDKYYLATIYNGTRINDSQIKVSYQKKSIHTIGVQTLNGIRIYDKERMLIELFRNQNKMELSIFREIVNEYRKIANELNGYKLDTYINKFTYNKTLRKNIYSIIF